ncbi:XK-related protein 9 [Pleurodeles waltl]|uniref:XK-related protein 9 n=1 Tax=Pleurodeles waltl TaxID=8319 RepID=UPI00370989ED
MTFTKCTFLMTLFGVVSYVTDTGIDISVAFQHYTKGHFIAGSLTLICILLAMIVVQIFSYFWFKEELQEGLHETTNWIVLTHLFQFGIFLRYFLVVRDGYKAVFRPQSKGMDHPDKIICAVADLTMLRLFETFLESIPQLILQIYFLMKYENISLLQYAFLVACLCSTAWSTVDFQISLRKALPDKKEIRVGPSMLTFLCYKIFTLTSWTLSIALFCLQNIFFLLLLVVVLWILSFMWTWKQGTSFCRSTRMEVLYRIIVGVILVFTFFNVRGYKTKIPIFVYYVFRVFMTGSILSLCWYWDPSVTKKDFFLPVSVTIVMTLGLGILSLILYYGVFHPNLYKVQEKCTDVPDGPITPSEDRSNRMQNFLML